MVFSIDKELSNITEMRIDFYRGVFNTKPVDLHEMPSWAARRICWATKGWGRFAAELGMQSLANSGGFARLIDHWGASVGYQGLPVLVLEPYADPSDGSVLTGVARMAEMLGVHARISDYWGSWWYPGRTCRIEFSECHCETMCCGCCSQEQLKTESRSRKALRDNRRSI